MSRRLFLERIAALAGFGVVMPASSVAAPAPVAVELQRSPVAGFQYHAGEAVWPLLSLGAALSLVREPDNRYDARAVRVDWCGQPLGYVPRIDNAAVSHLLDTGHRLHASIVSLNASANPWERVEFAVFLADRQVGGDRDA
ncbi:HIRAN domain-containing protein [Rhodocyclus tenuis]|uniref:HIRAN domain-containing protein n=1 Tax=Rhodocyclus tenuis TaxID=1066 RepID=UPI0019067B04|nr:HIRAN domain-containing protein [Rhodocyclus tenuis]